MAGVEGRPVGGGKSGECPSWCRGCGPDDPLHRSEMVTIGREGTGWMTVHLIRDRFAGRDAMLRVDTTRYGSTQTALLSEAHASRLIVALTRGRDALAASSAPGITDRSVSVAGWPYRAVDALRPGSRILIFGGVADLLGVDLVATFPTARLIHIRALSDGKDFAVMVPADFCPLVVDP
jgi:hypothetical protein